MFFKVIDKFFNEIKQALSFIVFAIIILALLMIAYWIAYAAKLTLPEPLNNFVWGIINLFTPLYQNLPVYNKISDILPIFTALILGILIYFLNCLMVIIEDVHEKAIKTRDLCRNKLEKSINMQLKKSFIDELQKYTFMLIKIKIDIEKENSYLSSEETKAFDTQALAKEVTYSILSKMNSNLIKTKGKTDNSVYLMITDFHKSKTFFMDLIAKSTKIINSYQKPFLKFNFGCAVEMYENITDFEKANDYLEKVLDLKVSNLIIASPSVKVYYETIHPELFYFKLLGEYSIKNKDGVAKTNSLYTIHRR